jgi:hypothetical protein
MAKYQNFLSRVGSNRDRAALRGIFSMFLTDGDPPALKDLVLASIILSGAETTQITISGAFTTGISIAADGTTGIAITSAFSGVNMISLAGTGSNAGILISGVCGTGLSITGACTTGISCLSPVSVSLANATTDAAVRAIIGAITASGTGMTTGYSATGVRGALTLTGSSTGNAYFYGTQGKITTSTGTFGTGSQAWAAGILGQLDISGATTYTANVGAIAAIWADCGGSAHANAIAAGPTFFDVVAITNSIATFKPNSMIRIQGDATFAFHFSAWDRTVNDTGCDYIVAGGDTTAASAHALKVKVGSETLYIRMHAIP